MMISEWRPLLAALLLLLAVFILLGFSGCEREQTPPMPQVPPQDEAQGQDQANDPE